MASQSPWYRQFAVLRILGTAFVAALSLLCTTGTVSAQSGIEVYMRDTAGYPGQTVVIPVMLNNYGDTIVAFQLGYAMDRPNVASFAAGPAGSDTSFLCLNPPECTEIDTVIGTSPRAFLDTAGTLISGWEFVSAPNPLGIDTYLRVTAISDTDFDRLPTGISPLILDQHLLSIAVNLHFPPDPFRGEAVVLWGEEINSHFSDPKGDLITPVSLPSATIAVLPFVPGDQDLSGFVDAVDLSEFIDYVFFGGSLACDAVPVDFNCDGQPDATDLSMLTEFVFFGAADLVLCP